ncbi:MAG: hypothetical protein HZB80_10870 [Deltaproteobacteria bacterium]|nr:hypothetical protein [Deltaproteobacteria bacterium]
MESGHHHEIVNLISNVGFSEAFFGAFSSFFSSWQFCIAQISPFFMVFLIAVCLIKEVGSLKQPTTNLLITSFGYLVGFSIIFALLGASGTGISGYLLYHIKSFRMLSGIFILLIALLMIAIAFVRNIAQTLPGSIFWILAPFVGASFAFIYSPCIPPTLSQLLNYASVPENAVRGFLFLIIYGIGLSTAFIAIGLPLAIAVGWLTQRIRRHGLVIFCCAFFLMILGIMAMSGFMVYYKAFLLSFFVE